MIEQITIENFKCFKNAKTINFSDLTLMSGLNNCGKSSVYQFLLLLKQSKDSSWENKDSILPSLKLNGSILQLGKPIEIMNDVSKGFISLTINFNEKSTLYLEYRLIQDDDFQLNNNEINPIFVLSKTSMSKDNYSYHIERSLNSYSIKCCQSLSFENLEIGKYLDSYLTRKAKSNNIILDNTDWLSRIVEFNNIVGIEIHDYYLKNIKMNLSNIVNCIDEKYRFLFDLEEFKKLLIERGNNDDCFTLNFSYHFELSKMMKSFQNLFFIPPFRGFPKRIYNDIDSQNPLNTFIDRQRKNIFYKIDGNMRINGTLEDALKYWIPQIILDIDSFKVNNLVEGLVSETFV